MRYLITGGAGFIGSHLVERLTRDGEQVVVLDDFSTGKRSDVDPWLDRIELFEGSITDVVRQWGTSRWSHFERGLEETIRSFRSHLRESVPR